MSRNLLSRRALTAKTQSAQRKRKDKDTSFADTLRLCVFAVNAVDFFGNLGYAIDGSHQFKSSLFLRSHALDEWLPEGKSGFQHADQTHPE